MSPFVAHEDYMPIVRAAGHLERTADVFDVEVIGRLHRESEGWLA